MIRLPMKVTLSPQEERVVTLTLSGITDPQVAAEMGISVHTVRSYWQKVCERTGQKRGVVLACIREGIEDGSTESETSGGEGRFQAFMDRLPGIAFIKDESRRLVYVSKGFEEAFGFSSSIAIGKQDEEYLPKAVVRKTRETESRLLAEGGSETSVEIDHSVLGGRRWLVHRFTFREGGQTLIGGTSFDVTELWEAEERFRACAEASLDSLVIMRPVRDENAKVIDFTFAFYNQSAKQYFGERCEEMLGSKMLELFPNRNARILVRAYRKTLKTGKSFQIEMRSQLPHILDRQVVLQAVRAGDAVAVSIRDVTVEREAQKCLREAQELLRVSFESLHQAVILVDAQGRIVTYNPAAQELFGCPSVDLSRIDVFRAPWKIIHESGRVVPRNKRSIMMALQGCRIENAEAILLRPDGTRRWIRVSCEPLISEDNRRIRGAVVSYMDISNDVAQRRRIEQSFQEINTLNEALEAQKSELKAANAQLTKLAGTDALTGLMNHGRFKEVFDDEVRRSLRYKRSLSVAIIDFDHFKAFNDAFGHLCGDEALKTVAQTIENTRRGSDMAVRYGGEEFILLMPETKIEDALRAAERLRVAIEGLDLPLRQITVSIGVATLTAEIAEPKNILALADQALYRAKASGRNRVIRAGEDLSVSEPPILSAA